MSTPTPHGHSSHTHGHGHDHDHAAHDHASHDAHSHADPHGHDGDDGQAHAKETAHGGGHTHGHGHSGHHHHHVPADGHGRAFAIAVVLNSAFIVVEFFYGFIANSTALMADAGHNLSDVLGLLLSWGAIALARRQASQRYTYGLRGASILAALANAMLLLLACGAIAWEAIGRMGAPPAVAGLTVSVVAAVGIGINGVSAWLFMRGAKDDLNIRGAYLHMAADAAISLGVAVAGLVMLYTGWLWVDPVVSLVIVLVIVLGTWNLLRESAQLALNAVPEQVDVAAVQAYLRQLRGVTDVCDLHVWGLSTTENALTVQVVMPGGHPGDAFMQDIGDTLKNRYAIHHSTVQIALSESAQSCALSKSPSPVQMAHAHHH